MVLKIDYDTLKTGCIAFQCRL